MWGDKEGGRERAPDSRTQGEVGLSACIGGLLATWRRMGVLGVYWLQACTETEEGSVRIHGLHGDSGCVGYAILGYCEVGGHANWMRFDKKGCIITALVARTLPAIRREDGNVCSIRRLYVISAILIYCTTYSIFMLCFIQLYR